MKHKLEIRRTARYYRKLREVSIKRLTRYLPSGWKIELFDTDNTNVHLIIACGYRKIEAIFNPNTLEYTPINGHSKDHYILNFLLITRFPHMRLQDFLHDD